MVKKNVKRVFLILGDQLSEAHPFLGLSLNPETDCLLMVESVPRVEWLPYHPQKLIYVFTCMRRFYLEVSKRNQKMPFRYVEFSQRSIGQEINQLSPTEVHVVEPSEPRSHTWLKKDLECELVIHPNTFFLADDSMLPSKPPYLMESFYRQMRARTGFLMSNGKPEGGQWNFDEQNRLAPPKSWLKDSPQDFFQEDWWDDIDLKIFHSVEKVLREHLPPERFGQFSRPKLPTHERSAKLFLSKFIEKRLEFFGPYEDAMIAESVGLYHSGLSPMMNLQILSAKEILEAVVNSSDTIPLQSKEGFVRQVLGWREFVRLIFMRHRDEYLSTNFFNFKDSLPPLYWGQSTSMNCLSTVVNHVREHAYSHHITRLMVLGNFALLSRTDPHEINRWFWAVYLDAFEWVVTPNVLGMSQFADGGVFATKPYVSGANYINKMSQFCGKCSFDPKKTIGEDACPFNALYWDFIDMTKSTQANRASFARRMGMMWSVWEKKTDEEKRAIRVRAEKLRSSVRSGQL